MSIALCTRLPSVVMVTMVVSSGLPVMVVSVLSTEETEENVSVTRYTGIVLRRLRKMLVTCYAGMYTRETIAILLLG